MITKEEVGAVQGTIISNTASSESASGDYLMTQCYYAAIGPNLSVSLATSQADPKNPSGASVREYWRQTFGRFYEEGSEGETREKGRVGEGKREEMGPAKSIDGIGEEAFWSGNRFGGALYVLKGDVFIRVSVGGPDSEETKIEKSKRLAQKALGRLP